MNKKQIDEENEMVNALLEADILHYKKRAEAAEAQIESLQKEVGRKDNALKILSDSMQSINDYSAEKATRNESFIALVDAKKAMQEGEKP